MAGYTPAVDPEASSSLEDIADALGALTGQSVPAAMANILKAIGTDAGSAAVGLTAVGRRLGKSAVEAETERLKLLSQLLSAGAISADQVRVEMGFDPAGDMVDALTFAMAGIGPTIEIHDDGEEGDDVRRMSYRRRKSDRVEIPPEAAPIASYLRVNRDSTKQVTSIYHKSGKLLMVIDDTKCSKTIGELIVEYLVPRICSGCGEDMNTPLCDDCKLEIVTDLVRGLDHDDD